jgi:hypothetical protein
LYRDIFGADIAGISGVLTRGAGRGIPPLTARTSRRRHLVTDIARRRKTEVGGMIVGRRRHSSKFRAHRHIFALVLTCFVPIGDGCFVMVGVA